jgi:hypothetical protein
MTMGVRTEGGEMRARFRHDQVGMIGSRCIALYTVLRLGGGSILGDVAAWMNVNIL